VVLIKYLEIQHSHSYGGFRDMKSSAAIPSCKSDSYLCGVPKAFLMQFRSISSIIFLLLCACQKQDLTINFPLVEDRLVIEGLLVNGRHADIRVGQSNAVLKDSITFRVPDNNTLVSIYEDDEFYQLLHLASDPGFDESSIAKTNASYTSDNPILLTEGKHYQVVVESNGFPTAQSPKIKYQSDAEPESINRELQIVQSPNCVIEGYILSARDNQPGNTFYIPGFYNPEFENGIRLLYSTAQIWFSDDNPNIIFESSGFNIPCEGNNLIIELIAIPRSFQEYLVVKDSYFENIGGLFANFSALDHNITNGYGRFDLGTSYRIPLR
jgi:hypothetical protein